MAGDKAGVKENTVPVCLEVFRVQQFVLVIGLIGLAISIGVGVIAFFDRAEIAGILFISALLAFLSIPTIISYIVTRLIVDAEGIEHRNGLGIRKRINWRDVNAIRITSQGNVIVHSEHEKIKIEPVYLNVNRLEDLMMQYYPNVFSTRATMTVPISGVRTEGGVTIFRRTRLYEVFGIILLMVGVGFFIAPATQSYEILFLCGVPGLLIFLSFAIARAYTGDEMIMYKNLIGLKKQIRWTDIQSVKDVAGVGLIIRSRNKKIKVSAGFAGYELLCDIVRQRSPKTALE